MTGTVVWYSDGINGDTFVRRELIALREQISNASDRATDTEYDPQDRSLADKMRSLRKWMCQLHKFPEADEGLLQALSRAVVQRNNNRTDKWARYCPENPDKKPRGDPNVIKISTEQRRKLPNIGPNTTA